MNIADVLEAMTRLAQRQLEKDVSTMEDKTDAIACAALFKTWQRGKFKTGDVRLDPDNNVPYECMQDHDSTVNIDWTIKVRTLWKPWHSRRPEWALPWEAPTGAHDMYKKDEYMIFTDGKTYCCLQDTNYSPVDYPQAWEIVE